MTGFPFALSVYQSAFALEVKEGTPRSLSEFGLPPIVFDGVAEADKNLPTGKLVFVSY